MSKTPIDQELDNLAAQVTNLTTVKDSMKAYLTGLSSQLNANATAPDRIRQIAATIQSDAADITTAITANTPAATP